MSGLAGIIGEHGAEALQRRAGRMVSAVAYRGTPAVRMLDADKGIVAQLGHTAAFDGLHIADRAIVGLSGRLDDPDVLATTLGLDATPSDEVLVYRAYLRWGTDFVEYIQGEYAIFLWDRVEANLVLVRDRFGVEPLYYANTSSSFVFASEIKAILAAEPDLRGALREDLIVDYIANIHAAEPEQTIFKQILRVPAASIVMIRGREIIVRRYYTLDTTVRSCGKDAPERFAERLSIAVRRRMRANGEIGALLSGGLDSSSITSLAAREVRGGRELPTYTSFYKDDPDGEDPYADAVRRKYGLSHPVLIDADDINVFDDLSTRLRALDRPPYGPNNALAQHVARSVAATGTAQVILCGHGGDEIVSSGSSFLRELAQAKQWSRLWSEIGDTDVLGFSRARVFRDLFLASSPMARRAARFVRMLNPAPKAPVASSWMQYVSPRVADAAAFSQRYDAARTPAADVRLPLSARIHIANLFNPMQVEAFEGLDQTRTPSGLLFRYPFWDKDLIELAISLPGEEKWSRGWPRVLLRRAMKGILPEEVAWRPDKYNYVFRFKDSLRRAESVALISHALNEDAERVSHYVNITHARGLLHDLQTGEIGPLDLFYLWRVTILSHWLEERDR